MILIVVTIVSITISFIISRAFKDVEKKDKGFVISYHKLTYRRRMIRTLWGIPFIPLLYIIVYWFLDLTSNELILFGTFIILLFLLQFVYNYIKWKMNEKDA